ncbi:MAG: O-antigen ligase family protein, partial [Mahellales bacterium]
MNDKKMNIYTQNESKKSRGFAVLLFTFFLITVLPQMLYIERGADGGTLIKAGLLLSFYMLVVFVIIIKRMKINIKELLVGLLFFAIQILVNIIPSEYTIFSSSVIIDAAIATSYYIFLVALFSTRKLDREDIGLFARLYQIFILYACLINIVTNWSLIPSIITLSSGYAYNFKSFFSNRNTFALFLLAGVFLSGYRLTMMRKNLLDTLIGLFIIMNLVLTLSRTSLLGMLVFFVVILVFREKKKKFKGLVRTAVLFGAIICLIVATGLADFFIHAVIRADAGSTGRFDIWGIALNILIDGRILSGVGYGISKFLTLHNTYLHILLSGGLLLMAFYVRVFVK